MQAAGWAQGLKFKLDVQGSLSSFFKNNLRKTCSLFAIQPNHNSNYGVVYWIASNKISTEQAMLKWQKSKNMSDLLAFLLKWVLKTYLIFATKATRILV